MKRVTLRSAAVGLVGFGVLSGPASGYAVELIQNGGFESPYLGPSHWSYPGQTSYPGSPPEDIIIPTPTIDGWTYDNSAIVNGQAGSDWYGPIPPTGFSGYQFAALQLTSSLSQTFTSPSGDLTLSWLSAGRPNNYGTYGGDQMYLVELDGRTIGSFSTVSSPPFDVTFSLDTLDLGDVSAGSHTLTFQGLATTDETAFLDNVSITAAAATVPEPSTWTAVLVGFAGFGAATLLRRGNALKKESGSSPRPENIPL